MALNRAKGNMYKWITHTWNTVKGNCYHNCSYCYMKKINRRFHKDKETWFDNKELKINLGKGRTVFVGSSNDLFAKNIKYEWIEDTLIHCLKHSENEFVFQTKNPSRILHDNFIRSSLSGNKWSVLGTTIESDIFYPGIMGNCEAPDSRAISGRILNVIIPVFVTIEPVLDFNISAFVKILKYINPYKINIGADSGKNNLPEPSTEKLFQLISELEKFTIVNQKPNLKRLSG